MSLLKWMRGYGGVLLVCMGIQRLSWNYIHEIHSFIHAVMELLELIRRLHSLSLLPWVIVGDFNEILKLNEKLGGLLRNI